MRPAISIRGNTVTEQLGGRTSVHHASTHEAAIKLAGELEAAAIEDERKRAALLEAHIANGVDVVRPYPVESPEPVEDPGLVHKPATSIPVVEPATPTAPVTSDDAPTPATLIPQPGTSNDADVEWSVEAVPAPLPATAGVSWDGEKVVLDINPLADAMIWRSLGGRTSTFEIKEGEPKKRRWSGKPGEPVQVRVGDENGPLILDDVVPQPEDDQPED